MMKRLTPSRLRGFAAATAPMAAGRCVPLGACGARAEVVLASDRAEARTRRRGGLHMQAVPVGSRAGVIAAHLMMGPPAERGGRTQIAHVNAFLNRFHA